MADAEALIGQADAWLAAGEWRAACDAYAVAASALAPTDPRGFGLHMGRATALARLGDADGFGAALVSALEAATRSEDLLALGALAELTALVDAPLAREALRRIADRASTRADDALAGALAAAALARDLPAF